MIPKVNRCLLVCCYCSPIFTPFHSIVIAPQKTEDQSMVEITLRFWKNGFSVNDGPLRTYDDPKSQEFLHHVKHGLVTYHFL